MNEVLNLQTDLNIYIYFFYQNYQMHNLCSTTATEIPWLHDTSRQLLRNCSLKNTPYFSFRGKKKTNCLKNYIIPERSAAENILSRHCQKKIGGKNTSYESISTTANQVTGGCETKDEDKKPFKNIFPEKGRPVLNTVQKRLDQSSIFLFLENMTTIR